MAHQKSSQQPGFRSQPARKGQTARPIVIDMTTRHTSSWTGNDIEMSVMNKRTFSSDKYLRGVYLGCGGWSTVYKVLRVSDGRVLAGKASQTLQQLHQEARVLRNLSHDHILKFVELYEEEGNAAATMLVTELCVEGTLQTLIDHSGESMARVEVLQVTAQISDALAYLHDRNMFHSDLKPRNILIRQLKPVRVILADCADIKQEGKDLVPRRGTAAYWSPEVLKARRHFGKSDDVWALGITLLGMVGQWPPIFQAKNDAAKYPQRCFDHAKVLKELNPDDVIIGLLGRMLAWTAEKRASAAECGRVAKELLGKAPNGPDLVLGLKVPEDFKPISFW